MRRLIHIFEKPPSVVIKGTAERKRTTNTVLFKTLQSLGHVVDNSTFTREPNRSEDIYSFLTRNTFTMDSHENHSSGDEFASILERESFQQSSADNGVLTHSNQEQVAQFYAPRPTASQPPYITSSVPQNAAYSTYFMPPYQTTPLQHAMSPYNLPITFINPQSPIPGLRQIAPKPPQAENPITVARSSASRPPDFIETVKQIRKELYALGGISEDQNPPVLETKDYSQWRKDVIQRWKPVS